MRTFILAVMAVFLVSLPVAEPVEAKRFGGGFSFGKSYSPKKATPPVQQKQAAPSSTQKATNTAPKRSGFGGLMAGLLAGGLFGALLFGGAFDGLQFMDLLLIAGVIFIVYKLMSGKKQAAQQQAYSGYGGPNTQSNRQEYEPETYQQEQAPSAFETNTEINSGWGNSSQIPVPSWFNKEAFLAGAREHFVKLQAAWDSQDWDEIKSYTAPELFVLLQQERAKSPQHQNTEVVSVMAELSNFIEKSEEVIASVNFYGWLKEDSDETTEFNETWHLARDMTQENADWFIVGIQQN